MMVMGLVMLGAIETNQAPLDVEDTTPIAALTSEPEAIVVRAESDIRDLGDLVERMKADPSARLVRRRLGRRHRPDPARPARQGGRDRPEARRSTSPTRAAARPTRRSCRARSRPASRARRSSRTRSRAARCACSPSRPRTPSRSAASEAPTIRDAGFDVVVENWRGVVAPPDILPAERAAMVAALGRLHDSPQWKDALERNGWTDFFKPGDEFTQLPATARTPASTGSSPTWGWASERAGASAPAVVARPARLGPDPARRSRSPCWRRRPRSAARTATRSPARASSRCVVGIFAARARAAVPRAHDRATRTSSSRSARPASRPRPTGSPPVAIAAALLGYALLLEPLGYVRRHHAVLPARGRDPRQPLRTCAT